MYESTLTCLSILFDKVVKGGVIIIDDYFSWKSCREAVGDFSSLVKYHHQLCELIRIVLTLLNQINTIEYYVLLATRQLTLILNRSCPYQAI